jgi:hypothetical protein
MSLADRQRGFGAAILDNRLPAPAGLVGPDGKHSPRRFAVYRNNVMVGLIDALSDTFPVVRRLVGDEFFRAMAGVYARQEPPSSPILLHYGESFPDFLTAFPPLKDLRFIPDVARIERGWVAVYHEAEAARADVSPLLHMAPAEMGRQRFRFHPALRLLRSAHPAGSIWQMNRPGALPEPVDLTQAEDTLILRPMADVTAQRLGPGVAAFWQCLIEGHTLTQAATAGFLETPRFDFPKALSEMLLSGALTGWSLSQNGDI